jgi:hypothetical protein
MTKSSLPQPVYNDWWVERDLKEGGARKRRTLAISEIRFLRVAEM